MQSPVLLQSSVQLPTRCSWVAVFTVALRAGLVVLNRLLCVRLPVLLPRPSRQFKLAALVSTAGAAGPSLAALTSFGVRGMQAWSSLQHCGRSPLAATAAAACQVVQFRGKRFLGERYSKCNIRPGGRAGSKAPVKACWLCGCVAAAARFGRCGRFKRQLVAQAGKGTKLRANHSLKRSASGRPPGPGCRYAVHCLQPGPGNLPLAPA